MRYIADDAGFRADVIYKGESTIEKQVLPTTTAAPLTTRSTNPKPPPTFVPRRRSRGRQRGGIDNKLKVTPLPRITTERKQTSKLKSLLHDSNKSKAKSVSNTLLRSNQQKPRKEHLQRLPPEFGIFKFKHKPVKPKPKKIPLLDVNNLPPNHPFHPARKHSLNSKAPIVPPNGIPFRPIQTTGPPVPKPTLVPRTPAFEQIPRHPLLDFEQNHVQEDQTIAPPLVLFPTDPLLNQNREFTNNHQPSVRDDVEFPNNRHDSSSPHKTPKSNIIDVPNGRLDFGIQTPLTTPSPNPFRLIIEGTRAETYNPPPPKTLSHFRRTLDEITTTSTTPAPPTLPYFFNINATPKPPSDNHLLLVTSGPFNNDSPNNHHLQHFDIQRTNPRSKIYQELARTLSPKTFTTTTPSTLEPYFVTSSPNHGPFIVTTPRKISSITPTPRSNLITDTTSENIFHGRLPATIFDPQTPVVIDALGRTHIIPLLVPLSSRESRSHRSSPKTYFLNTPVVSAVGNRRPIIIGADQIRMASNDKTKEETEVEITRGDKNRPRLSIRAPKPHESDIYPKPRQLVSTAS